METPRRREGPQHGQIVRQASLTTGFSVMGVNEFHEKKKKLNPADSFCHNEKKCLIRVLNHLRNSEILPLYVT